MQQECHLEAVLRILRYLKSTPGYVLIFSKNGQDADWESSVIDGRSTAGSCTFVEVNLLTRNKK